MGVVTVEPNVTTTDGGWVRTGGTTVEGVLSDDSDATYMTPPNNTSGTLDSGFANPTIPANAQVRSVQPKVRTNGTVDLATFRCQLVHDPGLFGEEGVAVFGVNTTSLTARAKQLNGAAWTDASLDSLRLWVRRYAGNAAGSRYLDADIDITYNEIPVATVTGPADDDTTAAGTTVTTTSTPTVAWTYSDPESDAQERYEVRVYAQPTAGWAGFDPDTTSQEPVWESGSVLSNATSVVIGEALANSTNYRAYVRVGDSTPSGYSQKWSLWAFREFDMALTPPPVPTLTSVTADTPNQRITVVATAGAGTPTTEELEFQRSDDGGTTWADLLDSPVVNTGGAQTVQDRFAPREVAVRYRVRAVDTTTGNRVVSAWVTGSDVTLDTDGMTWLRSPTDSTADMSFDHATTAWDLLRAEDQAVYEAEGREDPIVVGGTVRMRRGVIEFAFTTDADFRAFEALRARQEKLLFQTCFGTPTPLQMWVRLGDDLTETVLTTNQTEYPGGQLRTGAIAFREVASPS